MIIELSEIGKRFGKEWIFKNINYTISDADRLAVLGPNGSGKSTLLQIISGASTQSSGTIKFFKDDVLLDVDHVFKHLSIAAPYLELIEEMTLIEMGDKLIAVLHEDGNIIMALDNMDKPVDLDMVKGKI